MAPAATIAVLGDSLSASYGIEQARGWVHLLGERLKNHQYDYAVFNASISGETSAGGLRRLAGIVEQHHPAIVIIELGANDGLRGLPIGDLRRNLTSMIRYCRENNAAVLLIGIQLPGNYGVQYNQSLEQTYQDLATEYQLPLVPFLLAGLEQSRHWFQEDGLHPTADAQPVILENVWASLKMILDRKAARSD